MDWKRYCQRKTMVNQGLLPQNLWLIRYINIWWNVNKRVKMTHVFILLAHLSIRSRWAFVTTRRPSVYLTLTQGSLVLHWMYKAGFVKPPSPKPWFVLYLKHLPYRLIVAIFQNCSHNDRGVMIDILSYKKNVENLFSRKKIVYNWLVAKHLLLILQDSPNMPCGHYWPNFRTYV